MGQLNIENIAIYCYFGTKVSEKGYSIKNADDNFVVNNNGQLSLAEDIQKGLSKIQLTSDAISLQYDNTNGLQATSGHTTISSGGDIEIQSAYGAAINGGDYVTITGSEVTVPANGFKIGTQELTQERLVELINILNTLTPETIERLANIGDTGLTMSEVNKIQRLLATLDIPEEGGK